MITVRSLNDWLYHWRVTAVSYVFVCVCVCVSACVCVCVNVIAIQKQEFGTTMYHNCKNVCTLIIITKMLFQELSIITLQEEDHL